MRRYVYYVLIYIIVILGILAHYEGGVFLQATGGVILLLILWGLIDYFLLSKIQPAKREVEDFDLKDSKVEDSNVEDSGEDISYDEILRLLSIAKEAFAGVDIDDLDEDNFFRLLYSDVIERTSEEFESFDLEQVSEDFFSELQSIKDREDKLKEGLIMEYEGVMISEEIMNGVYIEDLDLAIFGFGAKGKLSGSGEDEIVLLSRGGYTTLQHPLFASVHTITYRKVGEKYELIFGSNFGVYAILLDEKGSEIEPKLTPSLLMNNIPSLNDVVLSMNSLEDVFISKAHLCRITDIRITGDEEFYFNGFFGGRYYEGKVDIKFINSAPSAVEVTPVGVFIGSDLSLIRNGVKFAPSAGIDSHYTEKMNEILKNIKYNYQLLYAKSWLIVGNYGYMKLIHLDTLENYEIEKGMVSFTRVPGRDLIIFSNYGRGLGVLSYNGERWVYDEEMSEKLSMKCQEFFQGNYIHMVLWGFGGILVSVEHEGLYYCRVEI